jgi:aromatic-L-amino-acid/L-tryptophan decarboxylase
MNSIEHKLAVLAEKSAVLEPTEETRNILLNTLQNYSNTFLNNLADMPAYVYETNVDNNVLKIDTKTKTLDIILAIYSKQVNDNGIKPASGGHVGYIPGGGIFTAALGDYLAAISNEYAGIYYGSPGAVSIENEVVNWLKDLFDFPETAIGNLTSGGSIANLIALTAARDKHHIKGDKIDKSVVYLSPQVHHCVLKALRIIGLEDVIVHKLILDEHYRIDTQKLEQQIKVDLSQGLHPFCIIASAGTTDTGAVDPLDTLGDLSKKYNTWFHIDGAYGGFFILVDSKKALFKGIEKADSLVIDPHKGLFLPYGLGAVLIKDKEAVFKSHHYFASYMQDAMTNDVVNPADVSPELTKHFRGLRLWLPLKLHGIEPFVACLEEKLVLTTYFRNKLVDIGFKVGPQPDLSVSYFWYPTDEESTQNKFNETLMAEIHKDGRVFLSSTVINGTYVIRMAVLSFRTKKETIDKAVTMIKSSLVKTKKVFGI